MAGLNLADPTDINSYLLRLRDTCCLEHLGSWDSGGVPSVLTQKVYEGRVDGVAKGCLYNRDCFRTGDPEALYKSGLEAGGLLGGAEHHVATPGQRVCPACQVLCRSTPGGGYGHVMVDKARLRMLVSPVGVWSKARDFFTRWEVAPNVTVLARRFPVASRPECSLVLFKVEEAALQMDRHFAGTTTLQALQTDVPFMMCSRAKTFCPSCNFNSMTDRGCVCCNATAVCAATLRRQRGSR